MDRSPLIVGAVDDGKKNNGELLEGIKRLDRVSIRVLHVWLSFVAASINKKINRLRVF
jgi:hypothetical protein